MNDGGPAFPRQGQWSEWQPGMSLRDYFAAAALTGLLASETADEWYTKPANAAERAYDMARAMLTERSKQGGIHVTKVECFADGRWIPVFEGQPEAAQQVAEFWRLGQPAPSSVRIVNVKEASRGDK